MKTYVRSYSLPAQIAVAIQRVATHMNVSQSALVAELIGESVLQMEQMFRNTPVDPSPEDVRRLRGESIALVQERVAEAVRNLESVEQ
jgi:hypothetical protein